MGKAKALVKVHPEGKYVVDVDPSIEVSALTPGSRVALRNDSYALHVLLPTKVRLDGDGDGVGLAGKGIVWVVAGVPLFSGSKRAFRTPQTKNTLTTRCRRQRARSFLAKPTQHNNNRSTP